MQGYLYCSNTSRIFPPELGDHNRADTDSSIVEMHAFPLPRWCCFDLHTKHNSRGERGRGWRIKAALPGEGKRYVFAQERRRRGHWYLGSRNTNLNIQNIQECQRNKGSLRRVQLRHGDGEPGITHLGITESGITESDITWVIGIRHNRNWYNGISYNMEVECGITESGITEWGITKKLDSGIRYNNKVELVITESGITESGIMESVITESGITESGITWKRNLA